MYLSFHTRHGIGSGATLIIEVEVAPVKAPFCAEMQFCPPAAMPAGGGSGIRHWGSGIRDSGFGFSGLKGRM